MSSTSYSQLQVYKHLLKVTQNIIYSSQIQQQILDKYQQLKQSLVKKITKQKDNSHYLNLLSTYRLIIDNTIKIVQSFQQQLQNEMQRKNYNDIINQLNLNVQDKIKQLQLNVQKTGSKSKLMHQEELNRIKYQFDQLDAKFENLGLLIEVHKKMHQIISEVTKTEKKSRQIDSSYKQRIQQLQLELQQVSDVNKFIDQQKITQEKLQKFKIISRNLNKLIFK